MIDRNFVLNLAHRDTDINEYLMGLYNMVVQSRAKTVVELGEGQSTYTLTAAVNATEGELYSCDIGWGAHLRGYPEGEGILEKEPRFHFTEMDDLEYAKTWDKPIDLLFLDTSHIYDQTKKELEAWPRWVRPRGIFIMHDTGHEAGDGMGCRQALNEWYDERDWTIVHLLDTKILGMSILVKI